MDDLIESVKRKKEKQVRDGLFEKLGGQFTRKGFERSVYILQSIQLDMKKNVGYLNLLEILEGKRTFKRQVKPKLFFKEFREVVK